MSRDAVAASRSTVAASRSPTRRTDGRRRGTASRTYRCCRSRPPPGRGAPRRSPAPAARGSGRGAPRARTPAPSRPDQRGEGRVVLLRGLAQPFEDPRREADREDVRGFHDGPGVVRRLAPAGPGTVQVPVLPSCPCGCGARLGGTAPAGVCRGPRRRRPATPRPGSGALLRPLPARRREPRDDAAREGRVQAGRRSRNGVAFGHGATPRPPRLRPGRRAPPAAPPGMAAAPSTGSRARRQGNPIPAGRPRGATAPADGRPRCASPARSGRCGPPIPPGPGRARADAGAGRLLLGQKHRDLRRRGRGTPRARRPRARRGARGPLGPSDSAGQASAAP